MAKPVLSGCVVFGIDLSSHSPGSPAERTVRFLLERMDAHQVPGTWFAPAVNPRLVEQLRGSSLSHEFGLTVTGGASSQDVRRHFRVAEAAGLSLRSCAVDPHQVAPLDLLHREGVRIARPSKGTNAWAAAPVQPQALRFGVWGLPVSSFLPCRNRFGESFLLRNLMFGMRLACQQKRSFQVVLDVDALATAGRPGERSIEKLLAYAGRLREEGQVQCVRLRDVDRMLRDSLASAPAQSILRRAA